MKKISNRQRNKLKWLKWREQQELKAKQLSKELDDRLKMLIK